MAVQIQAINTLVYYPERCTGCGMCATVCPHGVFQMKERKAALVRYKACIECGACQTNCPVDAISVDSGVGCASAFIYGILTGQEPTCDRGCATALAVKIVAAPVVKAMTAVAAKAADAPAVTVNAADAAE